MKSGMKNFFSGLGGIFLGSGIMFLGDPQAGRRRRALVRDKMRYYARRGGHFIGKKTRYYMGRARGQFMELKNIRSQIPASDSTLNEHVRAVMGHVISHPGLVDVHVNEGNVRLTGQILRDEVDDSLNCISRIRGVRNIENRLEICDTIEEIQRAAGRKGQRLGMAA